MGKSEGRLEERSGWVNTDVAAEVLGASPRSVRNYILNRTLVARKESQGLNQKYLVSVDSLYALRDRRKRPGKLSGNRRASSRSEDGTENTAEVVKETAVDMLRETLAKLETHIATNAELRACLELSERSESTLREELEGERRRHEEDVEQERSGRLEAQERAERLTREQTRLEEERARIQAEVRELREELEAGRSKGFWRNAFGG